MVGEPLFAGSGEALPAGVADGVSAAVVFVVGCDVADGFVEADGVVEASDPVELGVEDDGVGDLLEVGPLGLDVAEEALDPGRAAG
jgi:hypothetical protein